MKEHILTIFKNSNLVITNMNKLIEYINFCIDRDNGVKLNNTEFHHILPKSKKLFPLYSNLKEHKWNGVHLTYQDHYIAHSLLAEAFLTNRHILYAWNAMNSYKNTNKELISPDLYAELREKHRNIVINYNKTRYISDETREKISTSMKKVSKERGTTFCDTSGYVVVLDTHKGSHTQITVEEFRNDTTGRYIHNTKNKVSVMFWDGTRGQVDKEVYDNDITIGATISKRYIITDNFGNVTMTRQMRRFIRDNNISKKIMDYVNKGTIDYVCNIKNQFKPKKSINGWNITCLD